MSDFEYNEDFLKDEREICTRANDENIENNDVDEVDREIIRLVKINQGLWNKKSKTYSNTVQRDTAWESVASLLPVQMTGSEASKRFRTPRTMFGRHFKKIRRSNPDLVLDQTGPFISHLGSFMKNCFFWLTL